MKITSWNGRKIVVCSCGTSSREGICCRHIFALLDRSPLISDFSVRWLLIYAYYFLVNDQLTQIFRDALANEPPGIPLQEDDLEKLASVDCASETDRKAFEPQLPGRRPVFVPFSYWGQGENAGRALGGRHDAESAENGEQTKFHGLTQTFRLFDGANAEAAFENASQQIVEPLTLEVDADVPAAHPQERGTDDEFYKELSLSLRDMCEMVRGNEHASKTLEQGMRDLMVLTTVTAGRPSGLMQPESAEVGLGSGGLVSSNLVTARPPPARRRTNSPSRKR